MRKELAEEEMRLMALLRVSLFLILMIILVACGQQEQTDDSDNNDKQESSNPDQNDDSSVESSGIIAGELEATLQVEKDHAVFRIKNQTEQVKELILSGKTSYEYFITNENGETVFHKSKSKPQYEKKHPITLKQAEEIEYELALPQKMQPGKYSLIAVLHTEPILKAKITFTIAN